MVTIAVDTSSMTASCAAIENGKVLAELSTQHGKTHSKKIVPMIKAVLDSIDLSLKEVDLFAAAIGPGSFTGLRIGVVTIKSLAYSLKKPVCGIPTLDALAFSVPDFKGIVSPMLDARNNQVYTTFYRKMNNQMDRTASYMGVTIEEWAAMGKDCNEDVMILGDAADLHYNRLKEVLGDRLVMAPSALVFPRASSTALLAEEAFNRNEAMNAFQLEPLYLRKSQAERMKDLTQSAAGGAN